MSASEATKAAWERAAIAAELAARNIPAEVKDPKFEPTAAQLTARAGRKAIGPVELTPADYTAEPKPRNSHYYANRDYARLELAELAAETKRVEREAARAERAAAKRVSEARRLTGVIFRELPETFAELATAAGMAAELDYVGQTMAAAEALEIPAAEAAELLRIERAVSESPKPRAAGVASNKRTPDSGQYSAVTPAKLADVADWTADGLNTPAAVAGRAALDAIGPRAAGLVVTHRAAQSVTIARSVRVPAAAVAVRRYEELAAELAAAEAKLSAAEAASKAAAATKAKRPELAAERAANRIAASVAKLAKRTELAAKLADVSEALEDLKIAELEAFIGDPIAVFPLATAAEAAGVTLPKRADLMPSNYRDNGPTAKPARAVTDNTGNMAAALADGAAAELAKQEQAAADLAARTAGQAAAVGAIRDMEVRREAYKARRAEAARIRRAAAKMGNKIQARNAKRAAR